MGHLLIEAASLFFQAPHHGTHTWSHTLSPVGTALLGPWAPVPRPAHLCIPAHPAEQCLHTDVFYAPGMCRVPETHRCVTPRILQLRLLIHSPKMWPSQMHQNHVRLYSLETDSVSLLHLFQFMPVWKSPLSSNKDGVLSIYMDLI